MGFTHHVRDSVRYQYDYFAEFTVAVDISTSYLELISVARYKTLNHRIEGQSLK
ncbi:MAG: hypothetical protein ACKO96_08950 [Flammeovirgaceae bacterium]